MKIVTTKFKYAGKPFNYDVMHDVFIQSCRKEMPDVDVVTIPIDNVKKVQDNKRPGYLSNTVKLKKYADFVMFCDEDLILADCDMLCNGNAEVVFKELDFDIAITVKNPGHGTRCRINGGIIFVRDTPKAKAWVKEFNEVNEKMYKDEKFHKQWAEKYFGMNQAAMGYMIDASDNEAKVIELPTRTWNNCDPDWDYVTDDTVFIHIKSSLRDAIFSHYGYKDHEKAMQLFYAYTGETDYKIRATTYAKRKRGRGKFYNPNPEASVRLRVKGGRLQEEKC